MTNLAPAVRRLAEGGALTLGRAPEGYDAFVVAELTRALANAGESARRHARLRRPRQRPGAGLHRRARLRRARDRGAFPALLGLPALRPGVAERRRLGRADDRARAPRPHPRRGRAAAHSGRLGERADPARPAAEIRRLRRLLRRAGQQRPDGRARALAGDERLRPRQHRARGRRLCDPRRHPRSLPARRAGADQARLLRRHARVDPRVRPRDATQRRAIALARPRADERGAADDRDDPPLPPGLRRRIRRADPGRRRSMPRSAKAAARSASSTGCRCSTNGSTPCSTTSATPRSFSTRAPRRPRASASRRSPTPTPRGAPPMSRTRRRPTTSRCRPRGST